MNIDIMLLTVRQLLGKRRTLFFGLFALLPAGLAVAFRIAGSGDPTHWTASRLLAGTITAVILPLASLVFGTAALGSEIEDGTAVYLLAKPITRREIVIAKFAVAWLATVTFVLASAVLSAAIAIQGGAQAPQVIAGFGVGIAAGSLAYCALFGLLSIVTTRAFVGGLLYVFLWEGVVTQLFTGTRILSIRQASLGLSSYVAGVDSQVYQAELGGLTAAIVAVTITVAASWLAMVRLQRFELGDTG